jgi:hypothetical protein
LDIAKVVEPVDKMFCLADFYHKQNVACWLLFVNYNVEYKAQHSARPFSLRSGVSLAALDDKGVVRDNYFFAKVFFHSIGNGVIRSIIFVCRNLPMD